MLLDIITELIYIYKILGINLRGDFYHFKQKSLKH